MTSAQHPTPLASSAARGLGRDRRLMHAVGASVAAAGLVWIVFNHADLTPITPTPPPDARPPVQAGNPPPADPAPPAPTTTTAPPAPTTTPPTTAAAATAPAGAHPSPEEAAQAWWGHRVTVPAAQVTVHQRDRRTRDTFRVLVSAARGPQTHTGLLKVVRVGGNYWRTEGLWQEAG